MDIGSISGGGDNIQKGLYKCHYDNHMYGDKNAFISIDVKETEKSYIFKLMENTYRYSPAQIDMLFSKSNNVTIKKLKNPHPIRDYGNWFVIYPYQSGIPFLFEFIDNEKEK